MMIFKRSCRWVPTDSFEAKTWNGKTQVVIHNGSRRADVTLGAAELFDFVDWIEDNFERPAPFSPGDVVLFPSYEQPRKKPMLVRSVDQEYVYLVDHKGLGVCAKHDEVQPLDLVGGG